MESGNRKNDDCYFYYYSTCTRGADCLFRHEPTALGCEITCNLWQQGKCINIHCNLRHMHLKKNRKMIPCYWERQPGGCTKPHCPFLHSIPRENISASEVRRLNTGGGGANNMHPSGNPVHPVDPHSEGLRLC